MRVNMKISIYDGCSCCSTRIMDGFAAIASLKVITCVMRFISVSKAGRLRGLFLFNLESLL